MTKKRIYLDYAAGTPTDPVVSRAVAAAARDFSGNPSAIHAEGVIARRQLETARRRIAGLLGVKEGAVIFTAGATEANNLAAIGAARRDRGGHIITSLAEHPSVLEPIRALAGEGYRVTYLEPRRDGLLSPEILAKAIRPRTTLLSLSYINGETGAVQPLRRLSRLLKTKAPRAVFHTDASQAAGVLPIRPNDLGVDLLTVNGAKIYGPKGIAFLFCRPGVALAPILFGGGQEHGLRPGTENVPAAVGLALAFERSEVRRPGEFSRLTRLRDSFVAAVKHLFPRAEYLPDRTPASPTLAIFHFPGISTEGLVLGLDVKGVAVSSGSACTVGSRTTRKRETTRFSFGRGTTRGDLAKVLALLPGVVSGAAREL